MTHFQAGSALSHAINTAFILRLTWDSSAQQWCILVKPTAGDDARLFGDMEAAFFHVEMLMAERVQRLGNQTTGAGCTPIEQLQEMDR
jgi:hypothetical protein